MPQMYDYIKLLSYSISIFLVLIVIINIKNKNISKKIKGIYRIGPHNLEIISIIYGSLLGDAHAEKRVCGTRISFYQEDTHLKYIYYLHNLLEKGGYCNNVLPAIKTRLGIKGKIRKVIRFHT
jgi:ubiquinol-cytochrome c reductase cytochrome b subunit